MDLPVHIETKYIRKSSPNITIDYPLVTKLPHPAVQKKINAAIIHTLNQILIVQGFYSELLVEMVGSYEIKTNERGVLSLSLTVYSFAGGAHGHTITRSLTFDVKTGKQYALSELFKPDSNYVKILSEMIDKKMVEWDVPLIEDFTQIRTDQDFYIADHSLVIYFQLYEWTPYAYGFPYFPITIKDIEGIIREGGILEKLLPF